MSRLQSAAGRIPQRWSFGQWPLRRKLAAAIVLPVLLAFVFGGLRVKNDFDSSRQLSQAADTVLVIRPVVDYNLAVQRLAAAGSVGGGGVIAAITRYESAAADLRIALKADGVPESVKASGQSALSLGQAVRTAKTQSGFSDIVIDKSGNIATLMSTAVSDLGLSDDSASAKIVVSLQDSIAAQRAMTGEQLNLSNTDDAAANLRAIGSVGAETAALTRLLATATPDQLGQARQLLNENGRRNYTLQQQPPDKTQIAGLGIVIESSNTGYAKLMDSQLNSLETNLRQRAADHRSDALLNAAIVIGALALALGLVLALIRSLLVPIRAVRLGALDVANKRLPEAVAAMRDGEELPAFEAIPVHTTEEMGQLARAVDDLHVQARTLAGEQARLRVQVGNMFETLSRRSTSLIDQQLSLIERLESDEEDPKRLQSLFRLDHLAARMRRNSDSLLVLAGTSTRRGVSGSVSVSDAVRAAVSEVENYERIDIGDTSNDHVLGAVGSDLIHLVAEVVDNALSYSPPTSRVAIRGARTPEGGLLIEVADRGLGMPPKELAALNDQLAHGGDITADTARRMGLFVVGSLAKRHGIAVRLRRNGDDKQGVTVSVHLPAGLLADSARAERPARPATAAGGADAAAPVTTSAPPTSAVGGTTKAGLPARVRGASGATPSPVPGASKKLLPTRTPGAHGPTAANGIPAAVKPVIEGATAPADDKATTNGKRAEDRTVNGRVDKTAKPQVNGHAAPAEEAAEQTATVELPAADATRSSDVVAATKDADAATADAKADDVQADATPVDVQADATPVDVQADATPVDVQVDATPVDVQADATPVDVQVDAQAADPKVEVTDDATAKTDDAAKVDATEAAPVAPRAASGLPVRKPRATGITESREFEDSAPAPAADSAPGKAETKSAPAAKAGRLSWLPGRAKAAAEAARAESEAEETRQMPSNLSAWLDHRAKTVEASKARELGTDVPDSSDTSSETIGSPTLESLDSTTEMHVPEAWVAEAADAKAADEATGEGGDEVAAEAGPEGPAGGAPVVEASVETPAAPVDSVDAAAPVTDQDDTALPTRVPGATSAPAAEVLASGDSTGRPALRAHNTSFFGARRGRPASVEAPQPEVPVATAEVATAEAVVSELVVSEPVADEVADEVTEPIAIVEETTEVADSTEVTAEVVPVDEVTDEAPAAVTEAVVADVAAEQVAEHVDEHDEQVSEVVAEHADHAEDSEGDEVAAAPRGTDLNDTPIFRAMMSRWLTDDSAPASASWSTNEADQAWTAAARIEETEPLEESAAGLPMRRPGSYLVPGAVDESDEKPAAPAASRRDPEAIRRNLNRHKNGVSSARTEAQDGTHREEADVHH